MYHKLKKEEVDRAINSFGSYFKCKACEYGLGISAAALITAAIAGFPEDSEVIAELAEAVGLSEEVVAEIIGDVIHEGIKEAVSDAISKLCHKMGAC
jgi:hypothetical protein